MVEIVPYNPGWPVEFQAMAAELRSGLGPLAVRIDHIGSTAVPGLAAKDRIDLQVTVAALCPEVHTALLGMGLIQWRGLLHDHVPPGHGKAYDETETSPEWEKWLFIKRGKTEGTDIFFWEQRDVNMHIRVQGRANQHYPLLFRDYLRSHPTSARAYGELKRRLAANLADPLTYPDVKDPAVDLIYLEAEEWAQVSGWQMGGSDG
jgi:GrpB-like predicted nucleotidyltransferase (UPF0157 family)